MLRLTELKLPLDHAPEALHALTAKTLGIAPGDITNLTVFKRSFDARKAALLQVYIVDVELETVRPEPVEGLRQAQPEWNAPAITLEAALLTQFAGHPHIGPSPDMAYQPVATAPAPMQERPVVVGFGPCGIFAALILAQMGFKPIVLERGKPVRERTQDTWGLWRKHVLQPESNVQFGEGGGPTASTWKT